MNFDLNTVSWSFISDLWVWVLRAPLRNFYNAIALPRTGAYDVSGWGYLQEYFHDYYADINYMYKLWWNITPSYVYASKNRQA